MIAALLNTWSYKTLLFLHIVTITAAFGTGFLHTATIKAAKEGSIMAAKLGETIIKVYQLPGLIIATVLGVLLVLDSKDAIGFDEAWISGAFSVVILLLVLAWFVSLPAQRALVSATTNGGDMKKEATKASLASGLFHLGFVVLVFLMIWKPGQ